MIDPKIEEVLERLYIQQVEGGSAEEVKTSEDALEAAVEEAFVQRGGDGELALTEQGRIAGRDVVRRHRLAECLLDKVLATGRDHLDDDACRFEHILQRGLDENVCALLGHPRKCPHGKDIPEGECCRRAREQQIREVQPLCDAKSGDEGVVAYLATRDQSEVQKMMAMGILPGAPIKLIRRFPSYVFQVGYSQFAVDRPLAEVIYVHWRREQDAQEDDSTNKPCRRRRWRWRRRRR